METVDPNDGDDVFEKIKDNLRHSPEITFKEKLSNATKSAIHDGKDRPRSLLKESSVLSFIKDGVKRWGQVAQGEA